MPRLVSSPSRSIPGGWSLVRGGAVACVALACGLGALAPAGCANSETVGSAGTGGQGGKGGGAGSSANGGATGTGGASATTGAGGASATTGAGGSGGGPATTGAGGASTTTGAGGAPATTGAGGAPATTGAGGSTAACTLPAAAQSCAGTLPRKATLVDFATYTTTGAWGNSTAGDLTGGTSMFQGAGVAELGHVVQGVAPDTSLHVTGAIPVGSYAGFVLWFGPCVNASLVAAATDGGAMPATTGIAMPMGGSLGGALLKVQVQSNADYPVDVMNSKGACLFTSCATKYSQCVSPTATLTSIPATPALQAFTWSRFVEGLPAATTDGNGVVGLQFQFECRTGPTCNVDVSLGAIVLTL